MAEERGRDLNRAERLEANQILNDTPSQIGELSAARLHFRRPMYHPTFPQMPQKSGGEDEDEEKKWKRKEKAREAANDRTSKYNPTPLMLRVGLHCLLQDKNGRYSIKCTIVQVRSERSCYVETEEGRVLLRNRRFLRYDPEFLTDLQEDEEEMVKKFSKMSMTCLAKGDKQGMAIFEKKIDEILEARAEKFMEKEIAAFLKIEASKDKVMSWAQIVEEGRVTQQHCKSILKSAKFHDKSALSNRQSAKFHDKSALSNRKVCFHTQGGPVDDKKPKEKVFDLKPGEKACVARIPLSQITPSLQVPREEADYTYNKQSSPFVQVSGIKVKARQGLSTPTTSTPRRTDCENCAIVLDDVIKCAKCTVEAGIGQEEDFECEVSTQEISTQESSDLGISSNSTVLTDADISGSDESDYEEPQEGAGWPEHLRPMVKQEVLQRKNIKIEEVEGKDDIWREAYEHSLKCKACGELGIHFPACVRACKLKEDGRYMSPYAWIKKIQGK